MTDRPDPRLVAAIRAAISNAYYESRCKGQTMESAADRAVTDVLATPPMAELLADAEDARRLRESVAAIPDALRCWCCKGSKKWGRHEQSDGTWPTCTPCNGTGLRPTLLADAAAGRASEHDMKQRLQRVLDDYTDAQRAGWSASDYAYAMAAAPGDDDA